MPTLAILVDHIGIDPDRVPSSGFMTIGRNSSGTNRTALVTFPPLIVDGTITAVRFNYGWNYYYAHEGFSAAAVHKCSIGADILCSYAISGLVGQDDEYMDLAKIPASAYTDNWSFTIGDGGSAVATSKGYYQSVSLYVYYEPGLQGIEAYTGNKYRVNSKLEAYTGGKYRDIKMIEAYTGGKYREVK